MKRRGRPPYPDILTPREWEVLELLRTGLSNPEIAERLGVTRDAVKYHVSEILSKLGVGSRGEAAVWRPYERPWWAAGVPGVARRLPLLAKAALVGASVAALAGLAVLAYGVATTEKQTEKQSEPPAAIGASPSPESSDAAPEAIGEAAELTLGAEAPLPDDLALLLETGCFQCDGPTTGLIRVSRDAEGKMHREVLVSVGAHLFVASDVRESAYTVGDITLPLQTIDRGKGPEQVEPSIAGIAVSPDAQEIVVGICWECAALGAVGLAPDSGTILYRSTDGGDTWSEFARPGRGNVLGLAGSGRVLMVVHPPEGGFEVFVYPDATTVQRPEMASGVFSAPFAHADGTVGWQDRTGTLQRPDGTVILQVPEDPCPCGIRTLTQQGFGNRLIAVAWAATTPTPAVRLSVFSSDGTHIKTFVVSDQIHDLAWVSESVLAANLAIPADQLSAEVAPLYLGSLPALIDLDSHGIHPIVDPFLKPGAEAARNYVLGVQRR
jgi:DNA-binding CsgD family transcriptional regulator